MKRILLGALAVVLMCGGMQGAVAQSAPAAFLLYPNYRGLIFSDRPEIVVDAPVGASVTVRDKVNGSTVAAATLSGTAAAKIASSSLTPNHPYTVTVTQGGATLGTWDVTPVPATDRSAMNISYDTSGRFLMHGKPRFGLGVYDSGLSYYNDPAEYESTIFAAGGRRQLGGVNLNLYLNYHYGQAPLAPMQALMTALQNHGMMYLQTANCFNTGSYTRIPFSADQGTYATEFAKHPGAAGFYIMDECVDALIPETTQHHRTLSGLAPGTMTLAVTLAGPKVDARNWAGASDVLGTDPYPLYGAEPSQGYSHFQVADYVAYARSAVRDSRPIFSVLQFFKFTSDSRWPTAAEQRAHGIMSIVEGADGLFWWEIGQNGLQKDASQFASQMAILKANVNELAALETVIVAPDSPALVGNSTKYADEKAGRIAQLVLSKTNSWLFNAKTMYQNEIDRINAGDLSHSPMLKDAADIRTKTKVVDGKGYVFAYNYTNKTLPVTLTWQNAPGSVKENKTGQSFPVSGNSWSDTFGPYESRIYVIANGGGTAGDPPPATDPTVAFTNPAIGATVNGTTTVTVSASGGSGSGYSYKLAVDGTQVYSGTNPSFSWNTTTATNAAHTLTATVTDSAGRTGTTTRSVTVSNTAVPPPPSSFTTAFSSPTTDGTTVSGNKSIGMSTTAPWGTSKTWSLTVDGQPLTTVTNTGTVLWHTLNTTTLANGMRTLKVSVTANGATASSTRTINVTNGGTTAPPPPAALTAAFTSPSAGATVSQNVTVGMASSGGAAGSRTFKLEQVVGTTATTVSTQTVTGTSASFPWNTAAAPNGAVTLRLTVTDSAGTSVTASLSVTVTVLPTSFTATFSNPTSDGVTLSGNKSIGLATTAPWGQSKTWTILVDGKLVAQVTNTATVLWYTLNTTTFANGNHVITAAVTYNGEVAIIKRTTTTAN